MASSTSRILFLAIALLGFIGAAFAQDRPKAEYVSSTEINSKGLKLEIPGRGTVFLRKVFADNDPKKECQVHTPSVTRAISGMGRIDAAFTIRIKVHSSGDGKLYCEGQGSGCKITIETDDAFVRDPAKQSSGG